MEWVGGWASAFACGWIAACGGAPAHPDPGVPVTGAQPSPAECDRLHGFPTTKLLLDGGDGSGCQPDGCGVNGVWLGNGVAFRTLHLPRSMTTPSTPNEAGLRISGFKSGAKSFLVDVQGQQLQGKSDGIDSPVVLPTSEVTGADLMLEHFTGSSVDMTYDLHINSVNNEKPFWSCADGSCDGAPANPLIYNFTVTASDGCQVQLCKPGLDDDTTDLSGSAVIFRGDLYDDNYVVHTDPDTEVFNIACAGTDLYKLHMLRRTVASSSVANPVPQPERQAMLRMLTADYCGIGHPFTQNGTPLQFDADFPQLQPTPSSRYVPGAATRSVEAVWGPGGALCLDTPRLPALAAGLNKFCAVDTCTSPPTALPNESAADLMPLLLRFHSGMLVSGNSRAPKSPH